MINGEMAPTKYELPEVTKRYTWEPSDNTVGNYQVLPTRICNREPSGPILQPKASGWLRLSIGRRYLDLVCIKSQRRQDTDTVR